jgi:hypothetical protein
MAMQPQQLIRRDLPLQPGRRLRFTFTIAYEVPLDEDLLEGEGSATLEQVEEWLGRHGSEEEIWRAIHQNYDRDIIEHEVTLADVEHSLSNSPDPGFPYPEPRFETPWESRERENGLQHEWRSRVWLEEIPSPNVGASA